jgi:hypothetical protein
MGGQDDNLSLPTVYSPSAYASQHKVLTASEGYLHQHSSERMA